MRFYYTLITTRYWAERKFNRIGRLRAAWIAVLAAIQAYRWEKEEDWR